jgi:putative nucleotidyltransferase with HDIG domain
MANGDSELLVETNNLSNLLDSSYPLSQKFREACPGSYKHSQAIASMIEVISMDLGLDVTFMKVAAMYHDIGKMINPKYFTENQLDDENPHDKLDPRMSYQIITRHVSDTAYILINDENFPRELIEIVGQHHGTTVVKYFFDKSGSSVEDNYRYKGRKPQDIRSMILMICDRIEAMSRSAVQIRAKDPDKKFDPIFIIESTITNLMSDGQLNEVYMKIGDLQKIKEALAKDLEGTYQKRVDYSKAKEEAKLMEKEFKNTVEETSSKEDVKI